MFKRIALGMSGGVDSAVSALLLKNKGFDVQGVFMRNWDIADEKGQCPADADLRDAQYVCDKLKIPLHEVNFVKEYWNEVFCHLVRDYQNGFTPNPDILCNRNVKFTYFYNYAIDHLGADAIATGHYARTSFGPYLEHYKPKDEVRLFSAKDTRKDQTFFLCQVAQKALRKTMFPLGDMLKWEVKHMAVGNGLEKIAKKRESMGICFIGSRNFQNFIEQYIEDKPGKFVDINTGKVLGEHKGIHQWTVGQRSRLSGLSEPYYVCKKDAKENIIYVANGRNHPALYTSLFLTEQPCWIHSELKKLDSILNCEFRFQHTHKCVPVDVYQTNSSLVVKLHDSLNTITPGQFAVFYMEDECLGGARILSTGVSDFNLNYLSNGMLNSAKDLLEELKNNDSVEILNKNVLKYTCVIIDFDYN